MKLKKMKKEDLELLSYKDITNLILEESKKSISTADLFQKIIELLELPKKTFENKIAEYYTSLSTDKRFILLEDGTWDLKNRHKSDKVIKVMEDEEEEESEEGKEEIDAMNQEIEEDSYDDTDDNDYSDEEDELKDLVIIDEDELELE